METRNTPGRNMYIVSRQAPNAHFGLVEIELACRLTIHFNNNPGLAHRGFSITMPVGESCFFPKCWLRLETRTLLLLNQSGNFSLWHNHRTTCIIGVVLFLLAQQISEN